MSYWSRIVNGKKRRRVIIINNQKSFNEQYAFLTSIVYAASQMFLSVFCLFVCFSLFFEIFFFLDSQKRSNVTRANRFEIKKKKIKIVKKKFKTFLFDMKWSVAPLFLLHMLDLSLPFIQFFCFLIVTSLPPQSHLSLILANWTIQFLPALEFKKKIVYFDPFWNLGSMMLMTSLIPPKTIDLVVCYIRMFIPGPFKQLFLILLGYVILFCVCASTTSFLFLLPSSPWILCLPTWSRPPSPTRHSTSFSRWFSMQKNEKDCNTKILPLLDCRLSYFCRDVCLLISYATLFFSKKENFTKRRASAATTSDPPIIWFIISSRHNNYNFPSRGKLETKRKSSSGPGTCQNNKKSLLHFARTWLKKEDER